MFGRSASHWSTSCRLVFLHNLHRFAIQLVPGVKTLHSGNVTPGKTSGLKKVVAARVAGLQPFIPPFSGPPRPPQLNSEPQFRTPWRQLSTSRNTVALA